MQYEPKRGPEPQYNDYEAKELKRNALQQLESALKAVEAYNQTRYAGRVTMDDDDDRIATLSSRLLKETMFVGAAGEVCEACRGSGRRR